MLVDQRISCQIKQHTDIAVQFIYTFQTVTHRCHICAMLNGFGPQKYRYLARIWIRDRIVKQTDSVVLCHIAASSCTAAGNTHVSGHTCQSADALRGLLTVSMSLRSQAHDDTCRFCCRIFSCKVSNHFRLQTCDRFRPLRSLRDSILFTEQICTVTLIFRYPVRHMLLIKSDTVCIHEFLILQSFRPDHIRHGVRQSTVCRRADSEPLIGISNCCLAHTRIDHNNLDSFCLQQRKIIILFCADDRLRRIISP